MKQQNGNSELRCSAPLPAVPVSVALECGIETEPCVWSRGVCGVEWVIFASCCAGHWETAQESAVRGAIWEEEHRSAVRELAVTGVASESVCHDTRENSADELGALSSGSAICYRRTVCAWDGRPEDYAVGEIRAVVENKCLVDRFEGGDVARDKWDGLVDGISVVYIDSGVDRLSPKTWACGNT